MFLIQAASRKLTTRAVGTDWCRIMRRVSGFGVFADRFPICGRSGIIAKVTNGRQFQLEHGTSAEFIGET